MKAHYLSFWQSVRKCTSMPHNRQHRRLPLRRRRSLLSSSRRVSLLSSFLSFLFFFHLFPRTTAESQTTAKSFSKSPISTCFVIDALMGRDAGFAIRTASLFDNSAQVCFWTKIVKIWQSFQNLTIKMRKKLDNRILTLIENGVQTGHRSLFVVVGDKGRDQV